MSRKKTNFIPIWGIFCSLLWRFHIFKVNQSRGTILFRFRGTPLSLIWRILILKGTRSRRAILCRNKGRSFFGGLCSFFWRSKMGNYKRNPFLLFNRWQKRATNFYVPFVSFSICFAITSNQDYKRTGYSSSKVNAFID